MLDGDFCIGWGRGGDGGFEYRVRVRIGICCIRYVLLLVRFLAWGSVVRVGVIFVMRVRLRRFDGFFVVLVSEVCNRPSFTRVSSVFQKRL